MKARREVAARKFSDSTTCAKMSFIKPSLDMSEMNYHVFRFRIRFE